MSMSNTLYFIAPSALPFGHPVINAATTTNAKQVAMEVSVLNNLDAQNWSIGVTMFYKEKYSYASKVLPYYKADWLPIPSPEEAETMGRDKQILYGVAPTLAIDLHRATGVPSGQIMKYLRAFTRPDVNLISNISGGDGDEPLVTMARSLPGMSHTVACPAYGEDAYDYFEKSYKCERDGDYDANLYSTIIHLNDAHQWSREKIADWLDKLYAEGVPLAFEDAAR